MEKTLEKTKDVKLINATYHSDYKYHFLFSDGKESIVDFKPMIMHGTALRKYLDLDKFKKMKFNKYRGDIYWGSNWDMCFHLESYYNKRVIRPR